MTRLTRVTPHTVAKELIVNLSFFLITIKFYAVFMLKTHEQQQLLNMYRTFLFC